MGDLDRGDCSFNGSRCLEKGTQGKIPYRLCEGDKDVAGCEISNRNRSTDSTLIQREFNWAPHLSVSYGPGAGQSLEGSYSLNTSFPTLQQLQPAADPLLGVLAGRPRGHVQRTGDHAGNHGAGRRAPTASKYQRERRG